LLIRILQWPLSEAGISRTDEKRGSVVPEIDQNQTGLSHSGGHRRGKNVGPCKPGHAKWSCLTGLQIERCPGE